MASESGKQLKLEETGISKRPRDDTAADEAKKGDEAKEGAPPAKSDTAPPDASAARTEPSNGERPAKRAATAAQDLPKDIVEEGRLYFFYRPRVGLSDAHDLTDVQRFYMIMSPTSRKGPHRLLVIGKKRLPDARKHERFFGFVEASAAAVDELMAYMGPKENVTKTVGVRRTEPARVAGEGLYAIVKGGGRGRKTHLTYRLEVPSEPGEVQKDLNIAQEASFSISIKNPNRRDPPNAGLDKKADYTPEQREEFNQGPPGGYAWIDADDPTLLDTERCELLLIGASTDLKGQLGELGEHVEAAAQEDIDAYLAHHKAGAEDEQLLEKLKAELHAEKAEVDTKPAEDGNWE